MNGLQMLLDPESLDLFQESICIVQNGCQWRGQFVGSPLDHRGEGLDLLDLTQLFLELSEAGLLLPSLGHLVRDSKRAKEMFALVVEAGGVELNLDASALVFGGGLHEQAKLDFPAGPCAGAAFVEAMLSPALIVGVDERGIVRADQFMFAIAKT